MKNSILLFAVFLFIGCKSDPTKTESETIFKDSEKSEIQYATAFDIHTYEGYKEIIIHDIWPNSSTSFRYLLVEKNLNKTLDTTHYDAIIQVPIKKIAVTSTTHIPSLDMLDEIETLIGFPELDFISTESARARIEEGKMIRLGNNEDLNVERIIELHPDVLISFAVDKIDPKLTTISHAGIPVLYNSDWLETTALGKAEWIKFFGALYGKLDRATALFNKIELSYLETKKLAQSVNYRPLVMYGGMFKDIWHIPQGSSWAAQFIEDAQGEYIWKNTTGTGSTALGVEKVLIDAQHADIWLNPSAFTSLDELSKANKVYTQFDAFQNQKIYTHSEKKGTTGGVIYFELGPNRPDIVLKDLVHILHPELLPDYTPYFYTQLK